MGKKVIEAVSPTTYEPMFAPAPAAAAGVETMEIYARIGDIRGEGNDREHKDWTEVQSFNWEVIKSGSTVKEGEVVLKMRTNKSSPKFYEAMLIGKHHPEAQIAFKRTSQSQDFLKWTLKDVVITSYSTLNDRSGESVDEVRLKIYQSATEEYTPFKPDGSPDAKVKAGWDFSKDTAI